MPVRLNPTRLFAVLATTVLASLAVAQPPPPGDIGARAYFYTEPGFRGEIFVVNGGDDLSNLAFIQDSEGRPFNDRIRSVQLEGPVRVQMFQGADFRGATMWLNGDVPDLGVFTIGASSRNTWDRNISSIKVEVAAHNAVVFVRWDRRDAERVVRAAYRDILSRDPDGLGLRHYSSRLIDAGWSEEQLRHDLRDSDEFKHRDLDAIVHRAFRDILGREPDAAGMANYQRSLSRGMTEAEMRADLARSREGKERQVTVAITRAYRDILRRDPDPEGLKAYTELLQRKGWSESQMRENLKRSEEYRNLPRR